MTELKAVITAILTILNLERRNDGAFRYSFAYFTSR